MKNKYTDRSRTEQYQRCKRSRWLGYHEADLGLQSAKTSLPLVVGVCVHAGLEHLLRHGQKAVDALAIEPVAVMDVLEQAAVDAALAEFSQYVGCLELDITEQGGSVLTPPMGGGLAAIPSAPALGESNFAAELGLAVDDPMMQQLARKQSSNGAEYDKWLAREQAALVEGMVRAYARRRLRPLLEQYEVLEVEREGEWLLSQWGPATLFTCDNCGWYGEDNPLVCPSCGHGEFSGNRAEEGQRELWFQSRPDALLRDRQTSDLVVMSFKTTGAWDVRKERDAQHDMQGLSECVEIEQRLTEWWEKVRDAFGRHEETALNAQDFCDKEMSVEMREFLAALSSYPRISAIRYEYLLKGDRWKDSDLTSRFGFECRSQRSPLVRGYLNSGMAAGDEQWCWSWDYVKEDGSASKLYYKNWRSAPVWEHMSIARWIDMLDRGLGQACGSQPYDPLEACFVPPVMVYRNDDDLRDWLEQTEAQEVQVAKDVERVGQATDEAEKRHLLNVLFPQTRRACEYPSSCNFVKLCYGSEDIRRDPLASGHYKQRQVNHPQEVASEK